MRQKEMYDKISHRVGLHLTPPHHIALQIANLGQ